VMAFEQQLELLLLLLLVVPCRLLPCPKALIVVWRVLACCFLNVNVYREILIDGDEVIYGALFLFPLIDAFSLSNGCACGGKAIFYHENVLFGSCVYRRCFYPSICLSVIVLQHLIPPFALYSFYIFP
jgi:hypothetical protein